ncbi:MAG: hypothetical protein CM1200mP29_17220 [Verrucomicrobiota bacterium]|nr:MAG: hypothetical protein CM1200mP29_17220 [Verrucomicrobiota bacterium]
MDGAVKKLRHRLLQPDGERTTHWKVTREWIETCRKTTGAPQTGEPPVASLLRPPKLEPFLKLVEKLRVIAEPSDTLSRNLPWRGRCAGRGHLGPSSEHAQGPDYRNRSCRQWPFGPNGTRRHHHRVRPFRQAIDDRVPSRRIKISDRL